MKNINSLNLIAYIFIVLTLSSCNNDDDTANTVTVTPSNAFDEISEIAEFNGNLEGDIVILHAQSGPSIELNDDETTNEIIDFLEVQSVLYVTVHQVQTKSPQLFTDSAITFEQAKQFALESASKLKRVADFFKNQQGKTVYILGVSYGSLVIQELIATYGIDVADGYMVLGNRLNTDEMVWQYLSEGKFPVHIYDNDGNYTVELDDNPDPINETITEQNMGRLIAGSAFNRYVDRFESISSLSKLTYISGDRDEVAGPLSDQEIQFLTSKGANTIIFEGANHDDTIGEGAGLVKEIFGIE